MSILWQDVVLLLLGSWAHMLTLDSFLIQGSMGGDGRLFFLEGEFCKDFRMPSPPSQCPTENATRESNNIGFIVQLLVAGTILDTLQVKYSFNPHHISTE